MPAVGKGFAVRPRPPPERECVIGVAVAWRASGDCILGCWPIRQADDTSPSHIMSKPSLMDGRRGIRRQPQLRFSSALGGTRHCLPTAYRFVLEIWNGESAILGGRPTTQACSQTCCFFPSIWNQIVWIKFNYVMLSFLTVTFCW